MRCRVVHSLSKVDCMSTRRTFLDMFIRGSTYYDAYEFPLSFPCYGSIAFYIQRGNRALFCFCLFLFSFASLITIPGWPWHSESVSRPVSRFRRRFVSWKRLLLSSPGSKSGWWVKSAWKSHGVIWLTYKRLRILFYYYCILFVTGNVYWRLELDEKLWRPWICWFRNLSFAFLYSTPYMYIDRVACMASGFRVLVQDFTRDGKWWSSSISVMSEIWATVGNI